MSFFCPCVTQQIYLISSHKCWCMCLCALTTFLSQTGLFFGEVEGAVMNKLLQMGSFKRLENLTLALFVCLHAIYDVFFQPLLLCLYGRITLYDYQALCKEYAGSSDSARTLSDVSMPDRTSAGRFKDKCCLWYPTERFEVSTVVWD